MENSLLLTYLFPTQPSPLQSSVNSNNANGYLNVVVSAQGQPIYAQNIQIFLPVGVGIGYLSSNTPIPTVNTTRWTVGSAQLVKPGDLPNALQADSINYVLFNCTPQTAADQLLNYDLQFSFQITGVDSIPGPYQVGIGEVASTTQGGGGNPVFNSFNLTKAAATFYLDNFTASATSGNVNVPLGVIPRNTSFVLSWESNGNQFSLFTAKGSAPIYTGSDTQFTISAGITSDTTYILQAQIVGGPNSGGTSPNFEVISLFDSLTVICSNPDLTPNSINNATTINSTGNISTQGNLSVVHDITTSGLTVNGSAVMSTVQMNNTLNVQGATTLATTSAANLSVSGQTTLNGPLVAQASTVQALAAPNIILNTTTTASQTFVAPTDGTVVGYCASPTATNTMCVYWIFIVVAPVSSPSTPYQVGGVGGNDYSGSFPFGGPYLSDPETITLPVRKGDKITVYSTAFQYNGTSTTVTFYFFGQGGQTPGGLSSTFLPASDAVSLNSTPYNG